MNRSATVTKENGLKVYRLDGEFLLRDIEAYTHVAVYTLGDLLWTFPRKSARKYTPKGLPAGAQYEASYRITEV